MMTQVHIKKTKKMTIRTRIAKIMNDFFLVPLFISFYFFMVLQLVFLLSRSITYKKQ